MREFMKKRRNLWALYVVVMLGMGLLLGADWRVTIAFMAFPVICAHSVSTLRKVMNGVCFVTMVLGFVYIHLYNTPVIWALTYLMVLCIIDAIYAFSVLYVYGDDKHDIFNFAIREQIAMSIKYYAGVSFIIDCITAVGLNRLHFDLSNMSVAIALIASFTSQFIAVFILFEVYRCYSIRLAKKDNNSVELKVEQL